MSANMDATATSPYAAERSGSSSPALLLVARILIAALFLVSGTRKLLAYAETVGYFTKLGFPAPDMLAAVAIAIELGGGLMLLAGWRPRRGARPRHGFFA